MNTGEYKRGALNISFLKSILMAGVLVLLGSSVAFAQVGLFPDTGEIVQWPPLVGSGAVYEMHFGDGDTDNGTMEVDVVGKERVKGKDAFWIEITGGRIGRAKWVMKVLTARDDASQPETIRWIFQAASHPPIEMPVTAQQQKHDMPSPDDLGRETVAVPAGSFVCRRYRLKGRSAETWVSEKVVPWGLVKEQGTRKGRAYSMILLRTVTGAKDKITDTPQPYNPKTMHPPQSEP